MKVGIPRAEKIVANLTILKNYAIILKKEIYTDRKAGPLQEQRCYYTICGKPAQTLIKRV